MTESGRVSSTTKDGVTTISFFHPKGNSLPEALLSRLEETVAEAGRDSRCSVIVLRSEGAGAFCAGASFSELAGIRDEAAGKRFFLGFAKLILAMIRAPKFIVTRAQGKVVGGGVGLLAASDYVIAGEAAAVRLSELAIGIGPFVVGPVIERKIGLAAFSALAVAADWRDSRWALANGLHSQVHTTSDALDAAVAALASRLAGSNPEAMARLKKFFWAGTERWDELLDERAAVSGRLVLSEFARKAIAAAG